MTNWFAWGALGWVLNAMCQGVVLALAASLLVRVLPRTNASTRYAVWFATLLAAVAVPVAAPPLRFASTEGLAAPAGSWSSPPILTLGAPGAWPLWIFGVWVAVSVFKLARVARAWFGVQGLKRGSAPVDKEVRERFASLLRVFPGRRRVDLRSSAQAAVPMAAGLLRPAILIPKELNSQLPGEQFDQVLLHELAHIRRGDDWTNLAQKLIEAVFFFHPAVLWMGRRLNLEREVACDEWVVSLIGGARAYAACLTRLASLRLFARAPQLAPGAVEKKGQISRRVEALLGRRRGASPRFSRAALPVVPVVLVAAAAFGGRLEPVAVAWPAVAMPPQPGAAAPSAIAYAAPPKAVAVRTAAAPAVAERLRGGGVPVMEVVLIREWRAGPRNGSAGFCIFYTARETSWVRIIWVSSPPARSVLKQT